MKKRSVTIMFLLGLLLPSACADRGDRERSATSDEPVVLTLGAYTTPREAYGQSILPAFQRQWREQTGRTIQFRESYQASGAQSRAILGGFEADLAALSLAPDIERLRAAGLVADDWTGQDGGMVTRSVVVIGVRPGNPLGIRSWEDLAKPGCEVLTPNVRTSGGAMWNVLAIHGAALRGHAGVPADDPEATVALLAGVLRNVRIMDPGARQSLLTFERGIGDAIITYENEILVGRSKGASYDYVIPPGTILIENPVAVVTPNAVRHGVTREAAAFRDFLGGPEAQRAFAAHGLRPVHPDVAAELSGRFPPVAHQFTVQDLGGWDSVLRVVFAEGGAYDRALSQAQAR